MVKQVDYGYFRGRVLVQKSAKIGGFRNVFVKLQELHNELVYPSFGGVIMNPFKGRAKFFAGDLLEYRTNEKGVKPQIFLLKTFEVAKAVDNATTVYIKRDGFRHTPFVGDCIMVAPAVIGGTGTAVKVTAVAKTTTTVDEATVDVWQLTISSALTIAKGDIMVESEKVADADNSDTKAMLVKNINAVADCDADMMFDDVADTSLIGTDSEDFEDARYLYTPALGGLMYTHKMSPIPACVAALNRSNVNGWFKVNYYDMRAISDTNTVNAAVETVAAKNVTATTDPTTSTAAAVGTILTNTSDGGVFVCTGISGTTEKTYTWKEITFNV